MSEQVGSTRPDVVTKWQCRTCRKLVDVTAAAVLAMERFSAELMRRGDKHLDTRTIVQCDECKATDIAKQAARNGAHRERMADVIRRLKAARQPEQERELIKQLEALGHPDITGLVQAIRERREGTNGKRRKSGDDA